VSGESPVFDTSAIASTHISTCVFGVVGKERLSEPFECECACARVCVEMWNGVRLGDDALVPEMCVCAYMCIYTNVHI